MTGDPPSDGTPVLTEAGTGARQFAAVKLPSSTVRVFFRATCDAGTFSLKRGSQLIFRGDCGAGINVGADVPVAYVKGGELSWVVAPGTSWRIAGWAHP